MSARILSCGEQALTVELGQSVDESVNRRVIALAQALQINPVPGVLETVPTYRSLLVRFDPEVTRGAAMKEMLQDRLNGLTEGLDLAPGRLWRLPVAYGGSTGMDLRDLAADKDLSADALIAMHSAATYRVYMIGFSPGFAYLGGLPRKLHTPRLVTPRQLIPEGAIGIGGQQANINSIAGPSGWRFIGWTPVRIFDPDRAEPFLLCAGDRVQFEPVSPEQAADVAARQVAGETVMQPEDAS